MTSNGITRTLQSKSIPYFGADVMTTIIPALLPVADQPIYVYENRGIVLKKGGVNDEI